MLIAINKRLCNGCGLCQGACPDVFVVHNWMASVKEPLVPAGCEEKVRKAMSVCIPGAITVVVKVTIDQAKCRCCGLCTLLQPTIFKGKKGEKASVLVDSSPEVFTRHLLEAERNCEAGAITVTM